MVVLQEQLTVRLTVVSENKLKSPRFGGFRGRENNFHDMAIAVRAKLSISDR